MYLLVGMSIVTQKKIEASKWRKIVESSHEKKIILAYKLILKQ